MRLARIEGVRAGARMAAIVLACVASVVARGAGVMSAGGVALREAGASESSLTHGWVIATDGRPSLNVTVLHVPPRSASGSAGIRAADDGTVRSAAAVGDMPLGAAAIGDSLYMVFNGVRNRPTQHRVVSVRAVSVGAGSLWATMPRGRMTEEPVLDRPGRLAGLAGTGAGVAALMIEGDRPSVFMLEEGSQAGWVGVGLPQETAEWRGAEVGDNSSGRATKPVVGRGPEAPWRDSAWRIVGGTRWFGVLAWRGGDDWTLWRCVLPDATGRGIDLKALDQTWTRIDVSLAGTALEGLNNGGTSQSTSVQFGVVDGELIAMGLVAPEAGASEAGGTTADPRLHPRRDAAVVSRRLDSRSAWRPVARIAGVSEVATLTAMEGVGRVVVFWEDKSPLVKGEGEQRRTLSPPDWRIAELSAASGEVFYQGTLRLPMAAATSDYRALGIAMLVVLVGAVLFVIVPVRSQELVLPDGTSLASPGRRFVATAVDGFLGMLAASVIWGVPLTQVFGVEAVLTGKVIEIVATGLVVVIPMASALEALTGRSPGKALAGIEVVRMSRGEAQFAGLIVRPSLAMCLVRNTIKWIMPPVAMLGLLDPELRHRGDVLTRSAVVVRFADEEAEDGEGR